MAKKLIIHKANEMVRGGDGYSVDTKRALNSIIYLFQYNYNNGNISVYQSRYLSIPFKILRKMMNLENDDNYVERMKKALLELMETIELNNWTNPLDGKTYNWFTTRYLNEAHFIKENGEWIAKIEINRTVKDLMIRQSNFTKLDILNYANKMRTKYSMKLYEYLASFRKFRYIDITQQHLLKLFGLEENHKTYKHYAKLFDLLKRQIEEIKKKTDLTELKLLDEKPLRKNKKFRIIINPKAKKKVNDLDAKKRLDDLTKSLFSRF